MNKFFVLLLILFFVPFVHAETKSIKLLAVSENISEGVIVDLALDIIDGSGKVLLETYPLASIDTQISLRIAKTIACKTSEEYCLNKDFVYSIESRSPIVAGPSAGAAMTLLTIASLEDIDLDESVVMTGTINSGGVIGNVGGVKEKISAAAHAGLHTVLIPKGEPNASDLIAHGSELNISVIEVADVEEAYEIFTGIPVPRPDVSADATYSAVMKKVSDDICSRTGSLFQELNDVPHEYAALYQTALNLSAQAKLLYADELYYSSASRCFGANVNIRQILVHDLSEEEIQAYTNGVISQLYDLELYLDNITITNLGQLETAMIIRERIFDARENLKRSTTSELGYAIERTFSALVWRSFMDFPGKPIDESALKESCIYKIDEVQELYNYVLIYLPSILDEAKTGLDLARKYFDEEEYALCLFKSSKAQAQIDSTLSALYIEDAAVHDLLANKILAAEKAIDKQIKKGSFPILGYSYYEYARVLNESQKYTGLLYSEYGIEMSNLDVYFPQDVPFEVTFHSRALLTLVLGFLMGLLLFSRRRTTRTKITLRR